MLIDCSGQRFCYAFNSRGGCHNADCRYPHTARTSTGNGGRPKPLDRRSQPTQPASSGPPRQNAEDADGDEKQRLRRWKAQIPDLTQQNAPPLQNRLAAWIRDAYNLVKSGHSDARQQVVQSLHSEGGLIRIRELLEMAPAMDDIGSEGNQYLSALAGPLLLTISYHEVANSAFLEHAVDGVHIFIFGTGGRRAVPFFTCLSKILANTTAFSTATSNALLAMLTVMHRMIELNGTAQVNENIQLVVKDLDELLDRQGLVNETSTTPSRTLLRRVKQRMGLGLAIPVAEKAAKITPREALPTFEVGRDMPGSLSSNGPRHDNDHDNIVEIEILPTPNEVASVGRSEYLPIRDPRSWHLPGVEGLLDRHFRLVREDTVGQLRDAVRAELQKLRHGASKAKDDKTSTKGARTSTYRDIQLEKLHFDQEGLCADVSFAQPPSLVTRSPKDRERFYETTKCLRHDSLLCLVNATGSITFFSVSEARTSPKKKGPDRTPSRLWQNIRGIVTLRLTEPYEFDIQRMMQCFAIHSGELQMLVEFPGVLLPAFYHTLAALQSMSAKVELPFTDIIAPSTNVVTTELLQPGPPQYSLKPNFTFDLSVLIDDKDDLMLQPGKRFDFVKLQMHSTLDDAQQRAIIDALTRRMALIQGPPGTGKSYTGVFLIKALLANADKARLGPIICVCYTNHALDQLLEHLVRQDIKQVIRMGGQSKSELLKPINLREISFAMDTTATERKTRWDLKNSLSEISGLIENALAGLEAPGSWERIRTHLESQLGPHLDEFETLCEASIDEGFQTVNQGKRSPLEQWLKPEAHLRPSHPTSVHVRDVHDLRNASILTMSMPERNLLYLKWQAEIIETLTNDLVVYLKESSDIRDGLRRCRQEQDLRCLGGASVIGITTTGLARNYELLRHLKSKVLICEEAGEVLEAHFLTAMLPNIEHCILIGDHEQLRPKIANYELESTNRRGVQYSLDVSLFERLIHPPYAWSPKLPYSTLEVQRRMHPSIAELVRDTLYPKLKDHSSVNEYPQVKGLAKRLYWLDHNHAEDGHQTTDSKTNDYEVELTAALLTHLVRQGVYQAEDIAVLTPYLGQLVKLKKRLASQFEIVVDEKDAIELQQQGLTEDTGVSSGVRRTTLLKALRLASVDNFQGEEAKVVVVSLVRSNPKRKCGFLSTTNRINVLLSRARHGMYLIGDSTCYQSIPMWEHVLQILRRGGNFGKALALQCPRHMEKLINVAVPDDFLRESPEGGCDRKCEERLNCGHSCPNKCHARALHDAVCCLVPCPRARKTCIHPCTKPCGEDCGCCLVLIPDVLLPCGHISTEKCFVAQDTTLARCRTKVEKVVPGCGHRVKLECHQSVDELSRCPAICNALLSCGHKCREKCQDCNLHEDLQLVRTEHGKCTLPCGNKYNTCEHSCTETCHRAESSCKPCHEHCNVHCNHSRCSKMCNEPCAPCAESCNAGCQHTGFCTLPCAVPCDVMPCSKRCEKLLKCGHQCPSVCGEQCPSEAYCQKCSTDDTKQKIIDYTEFAQYGDMDMDHDPCYVLPCGHILSIGSLDGIMQMEEHYNVDDNHNVLSVKGQSQPFTVEQKYCPECRHPLRNLQRYNRIWRRGQLDESTKKFIAWSMANFVPLSKRLDFLEQNLSRAKVPITLGDVPLPGNDEDQEDVLRLIMAGSREEIAEVVLGIQNLRSRYKDAAKLRNSIDNYLKQVTEDEQPFGRVYNMVQKIRETQEGVSVGMVLDDSVFQTKQRLLATSLSLRCDLVILADFLQLRKEFSTMFAGKYDWRSVNLNVELSLARRDCLTLAKEGQRRTLPATEVEALVYFARFAALELTTASATARDKLASLRDEALSHLTQARALCEAAPSTAGLVQEIEQADSSLRDSTFYASVSNDERKQIVAAMASEFQVNGHWYRCVNGHPFTIANCGMAMEESACPECGARVGGGDHRLVQGNTRATDIEAEFGAMRL